MTATAVETTEAVPAEDPRPDGFRPEPGLGRWQVTFSCHPLAFTSWAIYAESAEQARERGRTSSTSSTPTSARPPMPTSRSTP